MQKHKEKPILKLILALAIAISITAGTALLAAGPTELPLAESSGALIADEDTKYITVFGQDPETKLITATIQIQNGSEAEPLTIQAITAGISFSESVAPYAAFADSGSFEQNLLFGIGESAADATEFEKYCNPLIYLGENGYDEPIYFSTFGSQYIQRDNGGGAISTKLIKQIGDSNPDLIIEPGQSAEIIEFYFMPVNGTDTLDIEMLGYARGYGADEFMPITPMLASGACILAATGDEGMPPVYTYAVSPESFKIHLKRPLTVSADNSGRTVTGYDINTMEWSYSESGPYTKGAPIVKDEAHNIYIKLAGDSEYSGDDELFGDYKKYADSIVCLEFAAIQYADYSAVDTAIQEAESIERETYTTGSLAALDTAVASVVRGLTQDQQATVDGYALAIDAAISGLTEKVPVTSIQIDAPVVFMMPRNTSVTFPLILNPGATSEGIVWSVSNPNIASVDNSGKVTTNNLTGSTNLMATDTESGLSHSIILRII